MGTAALGSALLVGCAPADPNHLGKGGEIPVGKHETALNAWLKIDSDNIVTVAIADLELGQGISTVLPMLVAEELGCAWSDVRFELVSPHPIHSSIKSNAEALPFRDADNSASAQLARWAAPHSIATSPWLSSAGTCLRDAWEPLRVAGAAARFALLAAAAREFGVPVEQLSVDNGRIATASGESRSFGELVAVAAKVPLPHNFTLKPPAEWMLIGTSPSRLDSVAKVEARAQFGADVRLPGMLFAAVRLCPVAGGAVLRVDDKLARSMPGVVKIVRSPSLLGASPSVVVVAHDFWNATRAAEALVIEWDEGPAATFDSESYLGMLIEAVHNESGSSWRERGKLADSERSGARRFDAIYTVPFLAHAAPEVATCTALYETAGKIAYLKIWAPTETPQLYAQAASRIANIRIENVTVIPSLSGGGFGYRGLLEPLLQAITAARAIPDTPVQVQWTREQDIQHDLYRPPAVARMSAWLSGEGEGANWSAWRARSAGPSVLNAMSARQIPDLIARRLPDRSTVDGVFDNVYEVPVQQILHIKKPCLAPLGFWRGGGYSQQTFFVESFVDEVAYELKQSRLALRLHLLRDAPLQLRVVKAAAELAGWDKPREPGTAYGLALHSAAGSICAVVVAVRRDEAGSIEIYRVSCAVDCGRVVHPDIVRQHLEGGVIFGLTTALYGQITIKGGRVEQRGFKDYRLMTMAQSPQINTLILPSEQEPGETYALTTPPTAPALCNALFRLTGKRIRDLPVAAQLRMA